MPNIKPTARKMSFMAPVENVTAKFARVSDTCSNTAQTGKQYHKWFGTVAREIPRKNRPGNIIQTFVYRKAVRTSLPSQSELDARSQFAFMSRWAVDTAQNLGIISQIQADFVQGKTLQGINPDGYTLRGWIAAVRHEQYENDPSITPTSPEYTQWPSA